MFVPDSDAKHGGGKQNGDDKYAPWQDVEPDDERQDAGREN